MKPYIIEDIIIKFADQQPNVLSWQNLIFNTINLFAITEGSPKVYKNKYLIKSEVFEKYMCIAIKAMASTPNIRHFSSVRSTFFWLAGKTGLVMFLG